MVQGGFALYMSTISIYLYYRYQFNTTPPWLFTFYHHALFYSMAYSVLHYIFHSLTFKIARVLQTGLELTYSV
jgi:hypothetical protein